MYQLLRQKQLVTYSFVDQSLILFLLQENYLDELPLTEVLPFVTQYVSYVRSVYGDLYQSIFTTEAISDQQKAQLLTIANEFKGLYVTA